VARFGSTVLRYRSVCRATLARRSAPCSLASRSHRPTIRSATTGMPHGLPCGQASCSCPSSTGALVDVRRSLERIHLSLAADSHLGSRAALLQPVLQTNFDESWRALNFGDLVISALIGLCCGFMGALYTQLHLLTIDVRRALAKRFPTGFAGFLADKCVALVLDGSLAIGMSWLTVDLIALAGWLVLLRTPANSYSVSEWRC